MRGSGRCMCSSRCSCPGVIGVIARTLLSYTNHVCYPIRFASLPVTSLRQKLEHQTQDLESEVDKLSKRLLYLETTHKNSREHIEQMLRSR